MVTIKDRKEEFDIYAASESFANDYEFHTWCKHLFILNKALYNQTTLDAYYLRAYITTLYELSNDGLEYAEKQKENIPQDSRYELLINLMTEILVKLSDDEYILLKFFRDSYCHIFTDTYNYYDKNGNLKTKKMILYTKDRKKYSISAHEFMDKAAVILGTTQYGELNFKKRLIQICYPIICKYETLFTESEIRLWNKNRVY